MTRTPLPERYSDRAIRLCILAGELAILVAIMFALAYVHWHFTPWHASRGYLRIVVTACLAYSVCNLQAGIVLHHRFVRSDHILRRVLTNQIYFICLTLIIFWSLHGIIFFPAYLVPLYGLMTLGALLYRRVLRQLVQYVRRRGHNIRKVAFIGDPREAWPFCEAMTDRLQGFHFIGYFADEEVQQLPAPLRYLGRPDDVVRYLEVHPRRINELYEALPTSRNADVHRLADYCDCHFIHFYSIPLVHEHLRRRISVELVKGTLLLSQRYEPLSRTENRVVKRCFDLLCSLAVLLTIFPLVYAIVAVVTKLTSPGPVLFRQRRTGLNGKEFWMYKFRSMHVNAEADTLQATPCDPRVTPFGRLLRRTDIDELPQFINVLFGEMSVIGPRPHMVRQTGEFTEAVGKYMVRHLVKPGITGWAQIHGFRGETTQSWQIESRVEHDIWYIEHWSLSLDVYIVLRTILNQLHGEPNAY